MITVHELEQLRDLVQQARSQAKSIGFIPTMGALHAGHLSLIRLARSECAFAVVSIFVNPLQFAPGEDLEKYPRRPESDAELLRAANVDILYRPDAARIYPPDFSTTVEVGSVAERGEGMARPGHFRGVATVVTKLFHHVLPDAAYFGRKDLQQVAVVRRMVRDLDFPLRIVVGETVREPDGLAMSSRNAYLSAAERQTAAALPRVLFGARAQVAAGERDLRSLERNARTALESAGMRVDYVEAVDPATMQRASGVNAGVALTAAVRVGNTRLIDNVLLVEE